MAWATALSPMKASLLLWALLLPAEGAEPYNWEFLYDHLLVEALDGDANTARTAYQELVHNLPADDPTRAEALYWLGRVSYAQGETKEAQNALREGVRTGSMRQRSLELLGQMALEEHSIKATPSSWDFESSSHGFVHPWRYVAKGSISTSDGTLLWLTTIDRQLDDRLVVGFDRPSPTPIGAKIRIRTVNKIARLKLIVTDTADNQYTFDDVIELRPDGDFVDLHFRFSDLRPITGASSFDAKRIDKLIIEDRSSEYGVSGMNEIQVDRFEVY
jgi:hypothetical protein